MTIGSSDCNRTLKKVMFLVDVFIKEFVVQEPMRVIKSSFVYENTNEEIEQNPLKAWNFSEIFIETFQFLKTISNIYDRNTDD